jgi:hypothetical protein
MGAMVLGTAAPGCQPLAAALFKWLIVIGKEVLRSTVMQYVERKLDELFLTGKQATASRGSIVVNSSDPLRGYYAGPMRITIRDDKTGKVSEFELINPAMIRSTPQSDNWQLDQAVLDLAKRRAQEFVSKL